MTGPRLAAIYGLTATLLFAMHAVISRLLIEGVDPLAFGALRGLIAGALLVAINFREVSEHYSRDTVIKIAVIALCGFGLNQVLLVEGLVRAGPADAALIQPMIPLATVLAAAIFRLEPIGRGRLAGVTLGFMALTAHGLALHGQSMRGDLLGNLMVLGNVAGIAVALVYIRALTRSVPTGVIASLMLLFGGLFLMVMSWRTLPESFDAARASMPIVLLGAFDVVIATAVGWLLYVKAIAAIGVVQAASYAYLQVPLTAIITWVALGETPPWTLWPTTAIVVFAVWLVARATAVKGPSPEG